MSEKHLGPSFEIHGGGLDLVFPHHENEIAQSRALDRPFARIWMHNGMLGLGGEEMHKSVGNDVSLKNVLDQWGGDRAPLLHDRPLAEALDFSDDTMAAAARASASATCSVALAARAGRCLGAVRGGARGRLQHAPGARRAARVARPRPPPPRARDLRARLARRVGGRATRGRPSGGAPGRGAGAAGLGPRRTASAARSRPPGGRRETCPIRPGSGSSAVRDPRAGLRPQSGGEEALRGPRQVLELWAGERALKTEAWLADASSKPQVKLERELSEAAGTRDHQGVVAWCEPYRYADAWALAGSERPLIVALDQVTDPHNLGAVCRTAEGVGATGVVLPAHGTARVTPAVCRASAGAVEHLAVAVVTNLARYLAEVKGPRLWVYGAAGDAATPALERRSERRRRARARRGGPRTQAPRSAGLRRHGLDSALRSRRVVERERRRGRAPVRGATTAA